MDGVSVGQRGLGHLVGRAALANDACEVRLGLLSGRLAVRARDDEPRKRELRLERIAGRDVVLVHHEPVPLAELRVGNPHGFAELLLGRLGETDVVPSRLAHELLVPGDEQLDGERDLRLLPVLLLDLPAHEEVVELVGAAELDVGLDRHRVVACMIG